MRHHAHAVHACESASPLACAHPYLSLLIPFGLVLLMLALSGLAAWSATRERTAR